MKVGLDVSPLLLTRAGTARYVRGLADALARRDDVDVRPLSFGRSGRAWAVARDVAWYPSLLPFAARRSALDVLHCTTFHAPVTSRVPLVVTVHDVAAVRHGELFRSWTRLYARTALAPVLRRADRVIAVSEFTKRELVELVGVREERLRVVPNAAGEAFRPDGEVEAGSYVLTVGTLEPRKNVARVVEATRRLGLELWVVGARGWGGVEVGGDGVRWLGEVSDDRLARLYRGALCVAYPSLYEGFGLPVLEAMRCGAAVVTTAGSAMEEVADGAAVLVDPRDPTSIADGIARAIERRGELSELGLERARVYSWSDAAAATTAVYRELTQ